MALPSSHIIVGMSGGVDSSVAAYLLKEANHRVEAVFMKNWEESAQEEAFCPYAKDLADVEAVCDRLDIPLTIANFSDEYWERVFVHFLDEYRAGRTPNPDILCNKEIKFKAFLDYAKQRGADYIATGHYVRSAQCGESYFLLKGSDPTKDQSYFLYALTQAQLSQSLFPVGHLPKTEVRALAKKLGFSNHEKKDSTGICFIGERKFKTFLNDYIPATQGLIETLDGEVMGEHGGLMFYTIGQRQGLRIGGKKDKADAPWYVIAKDMERNVLKIAQGYHHPALFKQTVTLSHLHFIDNKPTSPRKITAKSRYRQQDQPCLLAPINSSHYQVVFDEPQRAITPGQSMVFYENDICLGGGIIEQ